MKHSKMPNGGGGKKSSGGSGGGRGTQKSSASLSKTSSQRADTIATPSHKNPYPKGLA